MKNFIIVENLDGYKIMINPGQITIVKEPQFNNDIGTSIYLTDGRVIDVAESVEDLYNLIQKN